MVHYDPLLFYEDPYPVYRLLRDRAPVYHNVERSIWVLSRYDDVQAAGRDWQRYSSAQGVDVDGSRLGPGGFLDDDPPRHGDLRRILRAEFAPRRLASLEPGIKKKATELVDRLVQDRRGDLASDFARRLPVALISDLFGVPDGDQDRLERWYTGILHRIPGRTERSDDAVRAIAEMREYVLAEISERRRVPREDLLGTIALAHQDGQLSADEVAGMCQLLLVAGIHTTASLISNTLLLLEDKPHLRRILADAPERIPGAIEELLRYESPVQAGGRVTTRDVEVRGEVIPRDARVLLLWASANRDERVFDDPNTLTFDRELPRNLAFGGGIHFCLGAPLARMEARIAFETFFARVPEYEIVGPIERHFTFLERGITRMPAVLG